MYNTVAFKLLFFNFLKESTMSKRVAIGVDIGGTNTKIGLVSECGEILNKRSFATLASRGVDSFLSLLQSEIASMLNEGAYKPCGIGVGAPNANGLTGYVENPPNLPWGTFDLKQMLELKLKMPVFVDNDANVSAAGEGTWGIAQNMKNFVVVTLGTGVGTGVVVDGKVVQGHKGGAGEGGHLVVVPEGRKCGCGGLGHLECYASATGISQTIRELLGYDISVPELSEKLATGDTDARLVFEQTADYLGRGLAMMANILYPEAMILSGGVSNAGSLFLEMTNKYFEHYLFRSFKGNIALHISNLSRLDGAILGASSLVFYTNPK